MASPWERKTAGGGQQEQRATGPARFKTKEEYDAYLRVAHESVAIGQQTLSAVAAQQETLDRAEGIVDSNRYMIEKSARTLRGMSWWGSVVNYFTDEPAAPRPRTAAWMQRQQQLEEEQRQAALAGGAIDARSAAAGSGPLAGTGAGAGAAQWTEGPVPGQGGGGGAEGDRKELFARRTGSGADEARRQRASQPPTDLAEVKRIQDDYLENLGKAVEEQHAIGATLHGALVEQTEQIDRLDQTSEALHDSTRAVVRKASRVSQSSWAQPSKLHKFVAFRELKTGRFLTVAGNDLVLLEPQLVKSCQFAAYTHQTSITGLMSVVSRLWVGQNWVGRLGVRGSGFGKNEEFEVDWRRPQAAFLMSCSANWGRGGYLTVDYAKGNELRIGGYGPEDKAKAALFEIVDCETYRTSEYVNEVLRPLPRADAEGRR